jgi:hypothetical protein
MTQSMSFGRREFAGLLAVLGTGASPLAIAATSISQDRPAFTREMMIQAEEMAGITLTDPQRELALPVLQNYLQGIRRIREMSVPHDVSPAFLFFADPSAATIRRREPAVPTSRRSAARKPQGARP